MKEQQKVHERALRWDYQTEMLLVLKKIRENKLFLFSRQIEIEKHSNLDVESSHNFKAHMPFKFSNFSRLPRLHNQMQNKIIKHKKYSWFLISFSHEQFSEEWKIDELEKLYLIHITNSCLLTTIYVQNLSFCVTLYIFGDFEILIFQIFASKTFFDHFCRKCFVQHTVTPGVKSGLTKNVGGGANIIIRDPKKFWGKLLHTFWSHATWFQKSTLGGGGIIFFDCNTNKCYIFRKIYFSPKDSFQTFKSIPSNEKKK